MTKPDKKNTTEVILTETEADTGDLETNDGQVKAVSGLVIAVIVAFVTTWIAMIAGGIYVSKQTTFVGASADNNDLEKRLKILENQEQIIRRQIKANNSSILGLKKLEDIVINLPSKLPDNLENIPTTRDISQLQRRIDELEIRIRKTALIQSDSALSPIILSVLNLRERTRQALPYEVDINMLKKQVEKDIVLIKMVENLGEKLANNTSNLNDLKKEFANIASDIILAEKEDKADGIWEKSMLLLSKTVTIRKKGSDIIGDSAEAIIARAEAALELGNIKKAVIEIKKLSGAAAKKANIWLGKIENSLSIENIFADIYERVMNLSAKINDTKSSSPPTPLKLKEILKNNQNKKDNENIDKPSGVGTKPAAKSNIDRLKLLS